MAPRSGARGRAASPRPRARREATHGDVRRCCASRMPAERNDFIRDIIDDDLRAGRYTARRDAVPARAERLPPHRSREVDLPELRARASITRASATSATTTPTRRRKTSSTSTRSSATCAGSASSRPRCCSRPTTSRGCTSSPSGSCSDGKAYVCDLNDEQIREYRGTLSRARQAEPVPRSLRRREPRAAAPDEGGRAPRRRVHAAREDRHGVGEHEDARSAALPDPPRAPSPQRRRVVHLPDVRLRASARGRDRGHHALDLHARVREQPRALRLGARQHRARGTRARTSTSSRGSRSTTP